MNQMASALITNGIIRIDCNNGFKYANGGVGIYYIDMRRVLTKPMLFKQVTDRYSDLVRCITTSRSNRDSTIPLVFAGVPTTGVPFAIAQALRHNSDFLYVSEKENIYARMSCQDLLDDVTTLGQTDTVYIGLEGPALIDMAVHGILNSSPMIIMRRKSKSYGMARLLEGDLNLLYTDGGYRKIVVFKEMDDNANDLVEVLKQHGADKYDSVKFMNMVNMNFSLPSYSHSLNGNTGALGDEIFIVEDIWNTGLSSCKIANYIRNHRSFTHGSRLHVTAFIDRMQGASAMFQREKISHSAVTSIYRVMADASQSSLVNAGITMEDKEKMLAHAFEQMSYEQALLTVDHMNVCLGLDISMDHFPIGTDATCLPRAPYAKTREGYLNYCIDLLERIRQTTGCRFVKINLAFFNYIMTPEFNIIPEVVTAARNLGYKIILDVKIGDISNTQKQYVTKYSPYVDAITVNPFMGKDVFIGRDKVFMYMLCKTSNPSASLVQENLNMTAIHKKLSHEVGMTIGKVQADINTEEFLTSGERVTDFPCVPLLVPGIGVQGNSCCTFIKSLYRVNPTFNLRNVLFTSSRAIDFAYDPTEAMNLMIQDVKKAL